MSSLSIFSLISAYSVKREPEGVRGRTEWFSDCPEAAGEAASIQLSYTTH